MSLTQCTLTITDWKTKKVVSTRVITPKSPSVAAEIHSRNNPNCLVTVKFNKDGKDQSIVLEPYNMAIDQLMVDEGEMSINKFTTKWYGKVSKAKIKQIEKELEQEFAEEEEPIEEEMVLETEED